MGTIGYNGKVVATYDYVDERGRLLYQVVRYAPKDFRQRRPAGEREEWIWDLKGVRRVPFRLPQVLEAIRERKPIVVVEGEKDVQNLNKAGVLGATTNAGGAGNWLPEFAPIFQGAHVLLVPDNDHSGMEHMLAVASTLVDVANTVRLIELPGLAAKGDPSDWLQAGGTWEELQKLARKVKPLAKMQPTTEGQRLRLRVKAAADAVTVACGNAFLDDDALLSFVRERFRQALTPTNGVTQNG